MTSHLSTMGSRRRTILLAALAALGPIIFLVAEAVSAIAWTAGTYDYGHNFISDLGTTVCGSTFGGREMCSPLHAVMNVGFVAMGFAIGTTAVILARRLAGVRRVAVTILGVVVPVGMMLVAVFHGGVESVDNGTIALHVLGAFLAIVAGNTLAILVGANAARLGLPRWYRLANIVIGAIGLVGLLFIALEPPPFDPAIYERISVYSIFTWLFLTTAALVASLREPAGTQTPPRHRH
jgi:hypothetical protein